jgi:hypothetical protein
VKRDKDEGKGGNGEDGEGKIRKSRREGFSLSIFDVVIAEEKGFLRVR